jgi:hypothetical protein
MFFLTYCLWIIPHLILVVVFAGLLRTTLYRRHKFFFAYVISELLQFFILLIVNFSPKFSGHQYRVLDVLGIGVSAFLKLGIVYELSDDLLASRPVLAGTLRPLLRWTIAFLLLAAAVAAATQFRPGVEKVENIFRSLEIAWSVVLCGLLLGLLLFTRVFQLSWRSYAAGIGFGFGVFAAIELATSAFRAEFGQRGSAAISITQMAGYLICVLVWFCYLFVAKSAPRFTGSRPRKAELDLWDQELERIVRR